MAAVLVIVAINLRPAIASIAPLIERMLTSTTLTSFDIGLLSTLPLLLMGFGALLAKPLRQTLGEKNGITLGVTAIGLACFGRIWGDGDGVMLTSAIVAGAGIAIVQTLFPGYIKRVFAESASSMIGLYSSAIVGGAALAAGSAVYLAELSNWQSALALWAIPAVLAIVLWQLTASTDRTTLHSQAATEAPHYRRDLRSLSLLAFFGVGTGVFMLVLAWLPAYFSEQGITAETSGFLLTCFIIVELITALLLSAKIKHIQDKRGLLLISIALTVAGLASLVLYPVQLALLSTILLGMGIGIHFPLSLIVASEHFDTPSLAGDLTAFVQGGGYILAAIAPLMAGWIRDSFGQLNMVWIFMGVVMALLTPLALRYSPQSYTHYSERVVKTEIPATA
ncbi:hypothetical protein BGP75_14305 [Motiliproteus sp. MSK22-1]|nr:hypothetical protein BGP75_14305 [Motiliproteus sp. MSK22-1]